MCLAEGGGGSTPTSVENHEDSLTQVCLQHFGQAAIKACRIDITYLLNGSNKKQQMRTRTYC
jgi:hypothetical protein